MSRAVTNPAISNNLATPPQESEGLIADHRPARRIGGVDVRLLAEGRR